MVAGTTRERAVGDRIAAMCHDAGARYLGDVRGTERAELLVGARAVLFPTRLHEGLPLVIIKALLSGTPVTASDRGATRSWRSRRAIENVARIRPQASRAKAVREFDYWRMAAGYVREYERELGCAARGRLGRGASLHSC